MNFTQVLAAGQIIGCTFERVRTGNPDWIRLYMKDSKGIQIGRLSFHNRELQNFKFYKDQLTGPKVLLDESDEIYARFEYYNICGGKLAEYNEIVELAQSRVMDDLQAKTQARALLPDKKRKSLQVKDLRREVRKLVREVANDERDSGRTISTQNHEVDSSSSIDGEVSDDGSLAATV